MALSKPPTGYLLAALGGAAVGFAVARRLGRGPAARSKSGGSSTAVVTAGESILVPAEKLVSVVAACLRAVSRNAVSQEDAELVAQVLVDADARGVPSHGVNRLELYCGELEAGLIDPKARPSVKVDGPATALVDAKNCLGAVASRFAVDEAVRRAKHSGVAIICVQHSNHYGIAGFWADLIRREGLVGMSFTNTSPWVIPTRGRQRAVGTNPISFFAGPAGGDGSFELDMATSTVPVGKVEVLHRQRAPLPLGWGVDGEGRETESAEAVLDDGGLTPLGGMEHTAGYKGYGLGMVVELLCAILTPGCLAGPDVPVWTTSRGVPVGYGHCFIAIDPDRFETVESKREGTTFEHRLQSYLCRMRGLAPAESAEQVLVPGDPERRSADQARSEGVRLSTGVAQGLKALAVRLGVETPTEFEALDHTKAVRHAFLSKP